MARGTSIRAWTYEADVHCPACAQERFGPGVTDYPWLDQEAEDSEGNHPHPVFETDETPEEGEHCGTCQQEISPAYRDLVGDSED